MAMTQTSASAGMSAEQADRLFRPFERLHANAQFGGSGIGLATVQAIVSRHNGRVWAESMPGEGASFYFTLNENSPARVPRESTFEPPTLSQASV